MSWTNGYIDSVLSYASGVNLPVKDSVDQLMASVAFSAINKEPQPRTIALWNNQGTGTYPLTDNRGSTLACDITITPDNAITDVDCLVFNGVTGPTETNSLWFNSTNNHLYFGDDDLQDGTVIGMTGPTGPAGSGNVVGPTSATDNAIVRFDSTTGKLIQNSTITIDDAGNLNLPSNLYLPATNASSGYVYSGGSKFLSTYGNNLFMGNNVGNNTCTGNGFNTCIGNNNGNQLTDGWMNTAVGYDAMTMNSSSIGNTIMGYSAGKYLSSNSGVFDENTFIGSLSGSGGDTSGLPSQLSRNTCVGARAGTNLQQSSNNNILLGFGAGQFLTTGSSNIVINNANVPSLSLVAGSNNVYIAGQNSSADESNTIRIGDNFYHSSCYLSGISGQTTTSGVAVYVNPDGKLGTAVSSLRFKDNLVPLDDVSILHKLTPYTFNYKDSTPNSDGSKETCFGLIAEQLDELGCRDLVLYDHVKYQRRSSADIDYEILQLRNKQFQNLTLSSKNYSLPEQRQAIIKSHMLHYDKELEKTRQNLILQEDKKELEHNSNPNNLQPSGIKYHFLYIMMLKEIQNQRKLIDNQQILIDNLSSELKDIKRNVGVLTSITPGATKSVY